MYALGASRARARAKSPRPPAIMQRHVLSRLVQPSAPRRRRGGRLARVVPTASDGRAEDRSRAVEILIIAAVYPSGRCAAGARVESAPVFLFDLRTWRIFGTSAQRVLGQITRNQSVRARINALTALVKWRPDLCTH